MTTFAGEQLEARRNGVGGSEAPAVLGCHPFLSPIDVYAAKVEGFRPEMNADMERGHFLEDGIARWYAHREKVELASPTTTRHATNVHAFCTPDRFTVDPEKVARNVSIKSPRQAGDNWGGRGSNRVPDYCVLQLQWEDAILASQGIALDPVSHLVALLDGDLRIYEVGRDVELQGWMLEHVTAWFRRHVLTKTPPPIDGSDGAKAWLRRRFPKSVAPVLKATVEDEGLLAALKLEETALATAEGGYALARAKVEERIGEADGIEGAFGRVTWRSNKAGKRQFLTRWAK